MIKKRKAFTLIELLVVIAIIAVLMGILMPALNRVKKQANAITCRAHLKNWGLMFKLYTDDYEGRFNSGWDIGETTLWMNSLRSYYKDEWKLLKCPTCKTVVELNNTNDWGTFKSWSRETALPGGGTYIYVGSYSINSWTNNMTRDRDATRPERNFWKTTHNLNASADTIPVFGDSTWHDAWPQDIDTPPPTPDEFRSGNKGTTNEMRHFCIDRHQGRVNFVFMDWSVRGVSLKGLWRLKWHRYFRNTANNWTGPEADWPLWMRKYKDY